MRTIETKLYTFDELSDRAKEKARDWFRSCRDASDFECVIADAVRMGEILGFTFRTHPVKLMNGATRHDPCLWWSVGYFQSDGAWIEASYAYAKGAHRRIREEAPEDTVLHALADRLYALQKAYGYQLTATVKDDDHRAMQLDVDHPTKDLPHDVHTEMHDIVQAYEQWIYNSLRAEDEYQRADAQVDESILANEYEFTETGERA